MKHEEVLLENEVHQLHKRKRRASRDVQGGGAIRGAVR